VTFPALQSDDFELYGLTRQFAQDRTAIDSRWKELQREAHPDKFAAQGGAAQRLAMQWSVRINEGYQRLKDPLKRAAYLCELHGAPVNAENNTAMPADFLMQQMAWRESLDEASTFDDIDEISSQVSEIKRKKLLKCEQLIDVDHDFQGAVGQVRAMMFIERFAADIDARLEQLESNPH
jgi:molecular chaperone HscB